MAIDVKCGIPGYGLLAAAMLLPPVVGAGDWRLQESASFVLTGVERDNKAGADTSSLVFEARPRLEFSGTSGRSSADARYSLSAIAREGDNSGSRTAHFLNAQASTEVYPDIFFLKAAASSGLAQTADTSASVDTISNFGEAEQTFSASLMPEFRHHLGTYADLVSRNVLRFTSADPQGDTWTRALNVGLRSGRRFSALGWSLNYTDSSTRYANRTDTGQVAKGSVSYRIDRRLQVSGSVGYSKSDAPTRRSRNAGTNWTVGATWTPGPRTTLSTEFGHDFAGYNWRGNFSHVSRMTRITGRWTRALTDTSTLLSVPLEPGLDADGQPVVDPVTGLPLLDPIVLLVPTAENFINTATGLTVAVKGRRTTVAASAGYTLREYEVSGRETRIASLRLSGSRQLSGRTTVNAHLGASDLDSSAGGDDTTYDASLGLNTRLGRRSTLSARLSHRLNEAAAGNGYSENRFSITFSHNFD